MRLCILNADWECDPRQSRIELGLRDEALDDRTRRVLRVRIAVGNKAGEFLAQITKLADASVNEA
jgi:hypothetical protein